MGPLGEFALLAVRPLSILGKVKLRSDMKENNGFVILSSTLNSSLARHWPMHLKAYLCQASDKFSVELRVTKPLFSFITDHNFSLRRIDSGRATNNLVRPLMPVQVEYWH